MSNDDPHKDSHFFPDPAITRRHFVKTSFGAVLCLSLSPLLYSCAGNGGAQFTGYQIDSTVVKTTERMITFPYIKPSAAPIQGMPDPADPALSPNGQAALTWAELSQISDYEKLG